jgi:hypothetical protein
MRKSLFVGAALAIGLIAGSADLSVQAQPYGQGMMGGYGYGPGMMGPGYGPGYGMMGGYGGGYGMMGPGYGPGMMGGYGGGYGPGMMGYGPGYGGQGNLNLTTDNVKSYFERMIAIQGNSHLKVGDVKEKDADTIVADVVTKDNSLVERFNVNRHNGFYRPEEN